MTIDIDIHKKSGYATKVADWRVIGRPQMTTALIREWMIRWRVYQGLTCKIGICTRPIQKGQQDNREFEEKRAERRTIHEDRIAPPIDLKASFG